MGLMSFLRNRMGLILVIVIGFALFAFIASEVIQYGGAFFRGTNHLGEVGGEKISYEDYNTKVDQNTKNFQQQSGQSAITPQITGYIQEQTWNEFVTRTILKKEIDKLGLIVGSDEIQSMISGNNPNQQIVQAFGDPQTGQVDRTRLNNFLNNLKSAKPNDPIKQQWTDFVSQMIEGRKAEKYMALINNGLYVNSLEARDDYEARNKLVNFKYVVLDYASLPDNKVTLTDDDYSTYYNEHKNQFKNPQELRSFEYVSFNAAPTKDDTAATKAQVDKLAQDFRTTANDSLFVQVNSEQKAPLVYQRKGQLEPQLDSVMFSADKGFVYGPYVSNGSYKIAKLVDSRVGPDSVKARHILLNPSTEGGVDKAVAKADSLRKLIQGGKSFADLAKVLSVDKQSGEKGGDLGTFGRGAMIPVFEEAAFNGKPGDLKVVTSQFGVHLIEIQSQKGSSKVVKVAVVDKPLAASSKTQTAAYSKAQAFLGTVNEGNFDAEVKKAGLQKKTAEDVNGIAASVPGLDDAREVLRWAFKADKGDVAEQVFTIGNQYIVARLSSIKPAGYLDLDAVKKQIEPAVRLKVKAKQLTEKLQAALSGASNISQVAQKAGKPVVPVQNVVFANPIVPGLSLEYKLIGSLFGSKPNQLSKKVVEGQYGVFAYVVDGFTNPAPLNNAVREKQQLGQMLLQRAGNQVIDALKDKANVKDNRAKFL
jgi:peptidyl-prolyl cis-trans isomerase D